MATETQIRRALKRVPNALAFYEKYGDKYGFSRRTMYRHMTGELPPPMRDFIKKALEGALDEAGLLHVSRHNRPPRDRVSA
jgi:hypothetical protein